MEHIKKTTETVEIGRLRATLTIEHYDGQGLDTKVVLEGGCLCFVSGPERKQFLEDLNAVINKYRI